MIVRQPQSKRLDEYDQALAAYRQRSRERSSLRVLFDPGVEPRLMHRFLIEFCARGVHMTAPVAGWIERAGARCSELGLSKLGDALRAHARHEEGHEQLFVADTRRLVARYNSEYHAELDPQWLLDRPATPAIARYVELHESTIVGPAPYAQVAIELEIEGLSLDVGAPLLGQIESVLGRPLLECLSFIVEHTVLDAGHTALNQRLLSGLLSERPAAFDTLVETGRRALETYLAFLDECLDGARGELTERSSIEHERAQQPAPVFSVSGAEPPAK
jgi:hypothetical protein